MGLSTESIKASLQSTYGTEFVTADIRAWCAMNDVSYQTVAKKLKEYNIDLKLRQLEYSNTTLNNSNEKII